MELLLDPRAWMALLTLTALEIVLGVDNIVFISILTGKLPPEQRHRARLIGLGLAMLMRILLLLSLSAIMSLTKPLFSVMSREISGRDLILIVGGLFLLYKSTVEIHERVETSEAHEGAGHATPSRVTFRGVLVQIMLLDIVFSLDSVITAVGMANRVEVMVAAIVIAVLFMMGSSARVSAFIEAHPTVKVLALSFLLLIGVALVADGLDFHIPKGYIYFSMAFSVFVEALNIRVRGLRTHPEVSQ